MGNSITQGKNDGVDQYDSYRRQLYLLLTNNGYSVDFVGTEDGPFSGAFATPGVPVNNDFDPDHQGHWGRRVDWFLVPGRLNTWLQTYTVDVALVHLGSNDMLQNENAAATILELEDVIDTLRKYHPTVTIYLAQLLPVTNVAANNRITAFNALIPAIQTNKSLPNSPIYIVDQNTGFDPATDTYDGVHPNNAGELKMAQAWYNALTNTTFPVEWGDWNGQIADGTLQLRWETLQEENNLGFEIEHWQSETETYRSLGFVPGKNTPSSYTFSQPWYTSGAQIFRLKQIDLDGRVSYSQHLRISPLDPVAQWAVYPNPAHRMLYVRPSQRQQGSTQVQIRDLMGRLYWQQNFTDLLAGQSGEISLSSLSPGSYLIQIKDRHQSQSQLILIQ